MSGTGYDGWGMSKEETRGNDFLRGGLVSDMTPLEELACQRSYLSGHMPVLLAVQYIYSYIYNIIKPSEKYLFWHAQYLAVPTRSCCMQGILAQT